MAKNINDSCSFDLQPGMSLQYVAIVAKKLHLDDKITAFVKEIHLLGVVCKVLDTKTLSGETFCYQN